MELRHFQNEVGLIFRARRPGNGLLRDAAATFYRTAAWGSA